MGRHRVLKDLAQFDLSTAEGRKDYHREYGRRYRAKRTEEQIRKGRERARAKRELSREQRAARKLARAAAARERLLASGKGGRGLVSDAQYAAMLKEQNGVCMICRRPNRAISFRSGRVAALNVDHDHRTGSVRDLLCHYCNAGIGHFGEDPDLMLAARDYLIRWSESGTRRQQLILLDGGAAT